MATTVNDNRGGNGTVTFGSLNVLDGFIGESGNVYLKTRKFKALNGDKPGDRGFCITPGDKAGKLYRFTDNERVTPVHVDIDVTDVD